MQKSNLLRKRIKQAKGITLVALVITIIVLLILAGVTINLTLGENGLITRAQEAKNKYEEAQNNEVAILNEMDYKIEGNTAIDPVDEANAPKLAEGMIPVYYRDGKWLKADSANTDRQWYNYANKQWANIVTVADEDASLRTAAVGTEIPMDKITTFFVWIPRYAYSIVDGYKTSNTESVAETNSKADKISVTFLVNDTNVGTDGVIYEKNYDETKLTAGDITPKIVHPAFTAENSTTGKELTGIWVAKFEASGTNSAGEAVGNRSASSETATAADGSTYVKILPSVISWRDITVGESQYRSMGMSTNTSKYGWTQEVDSHLIKNSEWGAVAYLCYSKYGTVPMINGAASRTYIVKNVEGVDGTTKEQTVTEYYYDLYTGAGPASTTSESWYGTQTKTNETTGEKTVIITNRTTFSEETHGYNTTNGMLASTTGNVYGVYDMSGGSWERVAAYLDNGNGGLSDYGKSTTDSTVQYFSSSNTINGAYSRYWEAYEVSAEEKSNTITVGNETLTQNQLWSATGTDIKYNEARKRITDAIYALMEKRKGTGITEMAGSHSFRGRYTATDSITGATSSAQGWFITVDDATNNKQTYGQAWNGDYMLIGYGYYPFVARGGNFIDIGSAGVFDTNLHVGDTWFHYGFRPVLAF